MEKGNKPLRVSKKAFDRALAKLIEAKPLARTPLDMALKDQNG